VAGGYDGARLGRRLPARAVRIVTLLVAGGMTVVFFDRAFA